MPDFPRIQSPSSINTYKQCPRKYFYQYVLSLATKPSIHLVRGKIAHSVLEDFFKLDIKNISEKNYDFEFKVILHELLSKHWHEAKEEFEKLNLGEADVTFYLEETKQMIQFWLLEFLKNLTEQAKAKSFIDAFQELTPKTEMYFCSEKYGVQGYIDAILKNNEGVKIIDYKTSKRDHMSPAYKLQLAIYALLYDEKYGCLPDKVGIHFLRYCENSFDVNQELLDFAKKECEMVHRKTSSKEITDYPKTISFLCKWRTGQCDFYNQCQKE